MPTFIPGKSEFFADARPKCRAFFAFPTPHLGAIKQRLSVIVGQISFEIAECIAIAVRVCMVLIAQRMGSSLAIKGFPYLSREHL